MFILYRCHFSPVIFRFNINVTGYWENGHYCKFQFVIVSFSQLIIIYWLYKMYKVSGAKQSYVMKTTCMNITLFAQCMSINSLSNNSVFALKTLHIIINCYFRLHMLNCAINFDLFDQIKMMTLFILMSVKKHTRFKNQKIQQNTCFIFIFHLQTLTFSLRQNKQDKIEEFWRKIWEKNFIYCIHKCTKRWWKKLSLSNCANLHIEWNIRKDTYVRSNEWYDIRNVCYDKRFIVKQNTYRWTWNEKEWNW